MTYPPFKGGQGRSASEVLDSADAILSSTYVLAIALIAVLVYYKWS